MLINEVSEASKKEVATNSDLLEEAFDIPGVDPRDRMVRLVEDGEPTGETAPNNGKLAANQSLQVELRKAWMDEPDTLKRLENLNPDQVTDFISIGIGTKSGARMPNSGISDKDFLQVAKKWTNIKCLNLDNTELTSAGLKEIADKFKKIEDLSIRGTAIDDSQLVALSNFPNLKSLHLDGTSISDAGLDNLKGLSNLESLGLGNCPIKDVGIRSLKELKNLKNLSLRDTQITDEGLKSIVEIKQLEHLALSGTMVTAEGLKVLQNIPKLDSLYLVDTDIGDAAVETLAKLKNLKQLGLENTGLTAEGFAKLRKALPFCHISGEHAEDVGRKLWQPRADNNLPRLTIT